MHSIVVGVRVRVRDQTTKYRGGVLKYRIFGLVCQSLVVYPYVSEYLFIID